MRFLRKIFGILIFVLAIFLLIALVSYSKNDPSFLQAKDGDVSNLLGIYGAYIADPIVQAIGYAGLIFVLFIYLEGLRSISGYSVRLFFLRFALLFSAIFSLSVFLSGIELFLKIAFDISKFGLGGFVGYHWYRVFSAEIASDIVLLISGVSSLIISLLCLGITQSEYLKFFTFIAQATKTLFVLFSKVTKGVLRLILIIGSRNKMKQDENLAKYGENFRFDTSLEQRNKRSSYKDETKKKNITGIDNAVKRKSGSVAETTTNFISCEDEFLLPPTSLLQLPSSIKSSVVSKREIEERGAQLAQVLNDFGVRGKIIAVYPGPVVVLYELKPAAGTKSSRVIGLADDIARSMGAVSARIAVIAGKDAIGIELPNKVREIIYLRTMLETPIYNTTDYHLPLVLGENIGGDPIVVDLAKMPHLLVAGTTGSGKSVAINVMILSLLYRYSPKDCRIIMIDPKMLELSVYEGIPHLLAPVVTNSKKAVFALKLVVKEMESRYRVMSVLGIRNIKGYNQLIEDAIKKNLPIEKKIQVGFDSDTGQPLFETIDVKREKLPFIVVIVDEIADLMLVAGKEIEMYIQRLAQMARAAGIHIIMATQRPSVDVITGVIKANLPTRISFQVTSKIDSRTILGEQGAEQLLGMGDMLYMMPGGRIERIHSPFVHDAEVKNVVDFLKGQSCAQYAEDFMNELQNMSENDESDLYSSSLNDDKSFDALYNKAVVLVLKERKATTSYLQRCFKIGYNRAASLIERMEKEGVISVPNHIGKREVLK